MSYGGIGPPAIPASHHGSDAPQKAYHPERARGPPPEQNVELAAGLLLKDLHQGPKAGAVAAPA